MSASNKPAFVLCMAADMQGCGLHRVAIPLGALADAGVADGRIDMQIWPVEVAAAGAPDTIVWQRQVEDSQIEQMARYRAALPNTLFVYELDDYIGEVPAASFHAGFMPPNMAQQVAKGLALCDRATTTTEPLAEWLRELGGKDVRVVPNALPAKRLQGRAARPAEEKLRIGFAGGISHAGDLEILRLAMEQIGDQVTWVFFGMQPKNAAATVEFHEGVSPMQYLDKLSTLDLDLMLAPLEDNRFNRCKSNLRILEATSIGAAVIAQRLEPYLEGAPPVYGYADTPAQWLAEIARFIADNPKRRGESAEKLRAWASRNFTLEKQLHKRIAAWLPEGAWRPRQAKEAAGPATVLALASQEAPKLSNVRHRQELTVACDEALALGVGVLWLRPGTMLDEDGWRSLHTALVQDSSIASVVALSTDGPNSFPRKDDWTGMSGAAAEAVAIGAKTILRDRRLMLPAPTGPCILLSRNALAMGGIPDVEGCGGNEEIAIMEWGLRLSGRGWKHMQAADAYAPCAQPPIRPTQEIALRFQARSYISHVRSPLEELSPRERTDLELHLLRSQWSGLRPGVGGFGNDYPSWSALKDAMRPHTRQDEKAADRNICFHLFGEAADPDAEWIGFTAENVKRKGDAIAHFEKAVAAATPETVAIYADHENNAAGNLFPDFKPDFDFELFLARDYVTPICIVRRDLIDGKTIQDAAELYTLLLEARVAQPHIRFQHIPDVLATVELDVSPESHALTALSRQMAIQTQLPDVKITASRQMFGALVVRYDWRRWHTHAPKVSIIIPTLGAGRLIQPCVNTLLQHTAYPNFEVIVVHNGERAEPELGSAMLDPRVTVVYWDKAFNWSALNNWAVREHSEGDYLLFMNDDVQTSSMEGDWLDLMLGRAAQPDIGAAGARLIHPQGVIQHVGVVSHHGIAGHMHKSLPNGHPGHGGLAVLSHEASAVTGACMLVSLVHFNLVGGFDEAFDFNYNDTDFCMRLRQQGLRNVVEMGAELLHPEGTTRDSPATPVGAERLLVDGVRYATRWPQPDPYWNPNMALGLVQGGLGVQGLNCDVLQWHDTLPASGAERVLLINDKPGKDSAAYDIQAAGQVPFLADLSGFVLRLTAPNALNTAPWDVRKPADFARDMKKLGITTAWLCSLVGAGGAAPPVETLRFLKASSIKTWACAGTCDPDYVEDIRAFGAVDYNTWLDAYEALGAAEEQAA